jgi:hypothetical protein
MFLESALKDLVIIFSFTYEMFSITFRYMMYRDSGIIDVSYCKMHLKCVHMHSKE